MRWHLVAPLILVAGGRRSRRSYLLGDDLRTSEVVTSGPRLETFRKEDLLASFLDGR